MSKDNPTADEAEDVEVPPLPSGSFGWDPLPDGGMKCPPEIAALLGESWTYPPKRREEE